MLTKGTVNSLAGEPSRRASLGEAGEKFESCKRCPFGWSPFVLRCSLRPQSQAGNERAEICVENRSLQFLAEISLATDIGSMADL